jgi:hypothetical protein
MPTFELHKNWAEIQSDTSDLVTSETIIGAVRVGDS